MKLVVAVLVCVLLGISKAMSLFETETEEYQDGNFEGSMDSGPVNDEEAMRQMKQNMWDNLHKLVECFDKKEKPKERCLKEFEDQEKPPPKAKHCFKDLRNCLLSPHPDNLVCMEQFKTCMANL